MALIQHILDATEEIETPKNFVLWAVLSAIAAIKKKDIWFSKQEYNVYPNIYALIVGTSGLRKGYAADIARKLVKMANNTRIISGQNSIQGMLKELSTTESNDEGQPLHTTAQAFICTGELANLLIDDKQAHTILTDIYDTHYHEESWDKTLKEGKTILIKPCITLFAASNQRLLMEALPPASYEGGLIGRTMVIEEHERRTVNALMRPMKKKILWDKVRAEINAIMSVKGAYEFDSEETLQFYEDWYHAFDLEKLDDNTGTASRMQDHILKIAMVIAVSKRVKRVITRDDLNEAMDLCMLSTRSIKRILGKTGTAQLARQTQVVLRELLAAPNNRARKSDILRKHYGDFDHQDLNRIIDTLLVAGAIETKLDGNDMWILLDEKTVEMYSGFLAKRVLS